MKLTAAQKGELALLKVLARSLENGWIASRPTRDCRYDLILDDGSKLHRVQVKYCGRSATYAVGSVVLDFTKGGVRARRYQDHEVDAVLVYVAPADAVAWLGPERFHDRHYISIRYEAAKSGQQKGVLMLDEVRW